MKCCGRRAKNAAFVSLLLSLCSIRLLEGAQLCGVMNTSDLDKYLHFVFMPLV